MAGWRSFWPEANLARCAKVRRGNPALGAAQVLLGFSVLTGRKRDLRGIDPQLAVFGAELEGLGEDLNRFRAATELNQGLAK